MRNWQIKTRARKMMKGTKKWRLEHIVFGALVFFGLWFVFLIPPGHNGDEENHFLRVWQIATVTPTSGPESSGAVLPVALGELFKESKTPYRNVSSLKFSQEEYGAMMEIKADHSDVVPYEFPNTVVYSPVAYIPMYPAVWFGKVFDLPLLTILYAARILSLVAAAALLAASIKIALRGKWILAAAALLPMTVSQISGVNADGMTIAASFLFVSYVKKLAFMGRKPNKKQAAMLTGLMVALALIKTSYLSLLGLVAVIPILNKSVRNKQALIVGLAGLGIALLVGILWAASIQGVATLYSTFPDQESRLAELVSNPINAVAILLNTFFTTSPALDMNEIHMGFWGSFGWSSIHLPFIFIMLSIITVVIAACYVPKEEKTRVLTKKARLVISAVYLATVCAITLSLYAIISAPGSEAVQLLQGRYFIPVLPLLMLALHGLITIDKPRRVQSLILSFSIAVLVGAVFTVWRRFYDGTYL